MLKRVLMRALRVSVSVIIAVLTQYYTDTSIALVLIPALSALGKYLREQGMSNIPI